MNIKALLLITSAIFISACSPYIVTANPNHSASKSDEKEKIKNLFNEAHTTGVLVINKAKLNKAMVMILLVLRPSMYLLRPSKCLMLLSALSTIKATTTEVFKWDGQKAIPRMGKGHDPRRCYESFRYSGLSRFSSSYWT